MGKVDIKLYKEIIDEDNGWEEFLEPMCISGDEYEALDKKARKKYKCHYVSEKDFDELPQRLKELCVFNLRVKQPTLQKGGVVKHKSKKIRVVNPWINYFRT